MPTGVLLIINMQNDYVKNGRAEVAATEKTINKIAAMIPKFFNVVFVRRLNEKFTELCSNDKTADIIDKMPMEGYVFSYNGGNDIFLMDEKDNGLEAILNDFKEEDIYLCGVETDKEILDTATKLISMNLRPIIIKDLCASNTEKRTVNKKLTASFVGVINSSEIPEDVWTDI
ncbi:MAG: hypothetical protein AUK24_09465 [Syntrophaceae bacterium CG2_30_49_12]|nr:MAG: hypothetical protein AUK24_09465 [Syntrophaceae bacterium CG2_30_49_12]